VGAVTAAKILGRTGPITRFPTEAHFAAYTGAAPREVSSGDHVRHRLNRGGDRQLNRALHTIAITQIARPDSDGRRFYDRKRAEGKTSKEATRALKRRLAGTVYRTMLNDMTRQLGTGPAGQEGNVSISSVTSSHPSTGSSDQSLTGPAKPQPTYAA
jgi:transposase